MATKQSNNQLNAKYIADVVYKDAADFALLSHHNYIVNTNSEANA